MDYFLIQAESGMNGGIMQLTEEMGDAPPHWAVYFAVQDTDATAARVTESGGKTIVPPFDTPVGKIAVHADTQGAVFSIIKVTQE